MSRVESILEEDVDVEEDSLSISIDNKPMNENQQHFRKKVAVAKMWKDEDHKDTSFEDSKNRYGLRFDASSELPNGRTMVFEAGDLNCRSKDIVARLRKSYDYGAEVVLWWPKEQMWGLTHYMQYLKEENTKHEANEECTKYIQPYPIQPDLNTEVDGTLLMIDLKHLFEPHIWHQDHSTT